MPKIGYDSLTMPNELKERIENIRMLLGQKSANKVLELFCDKWEKENIKQLTQIQKLRTEILKKEELAQKLNDADIVQTGKTNFFLSYDNDPEISFCLRELGFRSLHENFAKL